MLCVVQSPDIVVAGGTAGTTEVEVVPASHDAVKAAVGSAAAAASGVTYVRYGSKGSNGAGPAGGVLAVTHSPLSIDLYADGSDAASGPVITVNARGLSYLEHRRDRSAAQEAESRAAAEAAAQAGGRKILDWGEDGA
jgi:hypothetical protein